jgi:preprotein translocase subunit SecD
MNQFPTWRYWLVIVVMLIGTLFALPNLYPQDDALQISREDRGAIDGGTEQRIRSILQEKEIPLLGSHVEGDRVVLRFDNDDLQRKAREAIARAAPDEYVIALTTAPRTPRWMRALGLKPMSLGLDLRGGVHFLYEVDVKSALSQALERIERDVRIQLRDKRIPFATATIQNDEIRVTLRDASDLKAAMDAIRSSDSGLVVTSTTSDAGPVIRIAMTPEEIKRRQDFAIQQNITTLRNRVDELGVSEPIVAQQGGDRIVVQLPGVNDPNEAIRILSATATLEFRLVDESNDPYEAQRTKRVPIGSRLYRHRDGTPILLKREIIVSGDQLTDATTGFGDQGPEVNVRLDDRGGKQMLAATRDNVGRRMAVVYKETKRLAEGQVCRGTRTGDSCIEEEVVTAPVIQAVLSSSFRITGFNAAEAHELSLLLRSGALATANYLVEQRNIGPSMGKDNVDKGIKAMIIGMVLTFAFLVVYYRGFGFIACLVLISNVLLLVALMSMLQASLSLPGIAGIVLTVGMAADANILIYERIREELRIGNSPQAAIHAGFDKAFSAIADSNITTLIAGIALFAFGTGPIKGFAVTLVIGIATSLFTAILGSRALIQFIWGRRRRLAELPV